MAAVLVLAVMGVSEMLTAVPIDTNTMKNFGHSIKNGILPSLSHSFMLTADCTV